jgi:hypothetical protein
VAQRRMARRRCSNIPGNLGDHVHGRD